MHSLEAACEDARRRTDIFQPSLALLHLTCNRASRSSFLPLAIFKRRTSIVFKDRETFILILLPRARFLTHSGAMVRSPAAAEITYLLTPSSSLPLIACLLPYRANPPINPSLHSLAHLLAIAATESDERTYVSCIMYVVCNSTSCSQGPLQG